ncbi:MAG: hypothetical protein GY768_05535 [Planctomycetaceae bacterium]|nr:hypothetical protein [Planctomycetaceae bacterium]
MLDLILLAVDLDQVLQIVVFAIIVISSLVGQFFKGKAERKKNVNRRKPQPIDDADRPRLENEIEAMLRRAVGAEEVKKTPPQLEKEVEITRKRVKPLASVDQPVVSAELVVKPVVTAEPSSNRRESIAEHVSRHMGGSVHSSTDSASVFGSDVSQIGEQSEDRIQRKFDHKLGTLNPQEADNLPVDDQESQSLAARVVTMLHSPEDVKAAIVLNEILRRPQL